MKPLIGVLCCNEFAERPIQAVASRFIAPLARLSDANVLLVPALADTLDARSIARRLDGLLLTGSRSNVAAARYGGHRDQTPLDEARDEVALALADAMIEAGQPVFGICRGLQELNVLFGGTLRGDLDGHHLADEDRPFECLFAHGHDVTLRETGLLARATGARRLAVNSVHRQGIDRLGAGLDVEALSPEDGLVEGFSARPNGAQVLAVQWHPEWDVERQAGSRAFFQLIGEALAA
ncbi:gamma-glutamyl-gamma-aminobutyrate hydrolase family protein [Sphingomonas sp. HITSZ_GF]|uniref:gamma-glutamyl-gamma-aminobutyrate hydrolase family protein n=1 Tax=Sphingomonas sp. HITSZ_GF TaxID=3037247 RepID=UPI00240E1633|nr:gamma-glutamyl-gamma-aminobutyrate hydrolase family protein [Sphingomonas sp. HITSZ_GF]MDG2535710.1 gamma-glutamyl-gamma-aminobutyrate hydrolase family protein [Sphingomonas sp. HITSZ_GF]